MGKRMMPNQVEDTGGPAPKPAPKRYQISLTFDELDRITSWAIQEAEKATAKAFMNPVTEARVAEALWLRTLRDKLSSRRMAADLQE